MGISLALTPVLPFMAIPSAIGAYKTHKYNKAKELIESQHPEVTRSPDDEIFNANVRKVARHYSRGSIGLSFSTALAPFLPHMVLPAGVSAYVLHKAEKDRQQLSQQMVANGFRIRKRDVTAAMAQVVLEKMILIPITLGHDDLVLAFSQTAISQLGELHQSLIDIPVIHQVNELVNAPVERVQESLHIETSVERLEIRDSAGVNIGGWQDPPGILARNVLIGGGVAASVDWVTCRPLEYKDGRLYEIPPNKVQSPAGQRSIAYGRG